MTYEYETISVRIDRKVLSATIRNPPCNVMSVQMLADLTDLGDRTSSDEDLVEGIPVDKVSVFVRPLGSELHSLDGDVRGGSREEGDRPRALTGRHQRQVTRTSSNLRQLQIVDRGLPEDL